MCVQYTGLTPSDWAHIFIHNSTFSYGVLIVHPPVPPPPPNAPFSYFCNPSFLSFYPHFLYLSLFVLFLRICNFWALVFSRFFGWRNLNTSLISKILYNEKRSKAIIYNGNLDTATKRKIIWQYTEWLLCITYFTTYNLFLKRFSLPIQAPNE